jgi:hypothetical protein
VAFLGVHGDWCAGKSALERIDAALSGNDGVLCLKFEGIVATPLKSVRSTKANEKDDVKYRRCRCPKWIDGYVDGKRAPHQLRDQLQESTPSTSGDAGLAAPAYYTLLVADAASSY